MKATGYVQVVPSYYRSGGVRGLRLVKLSKWSPCDPAGLVVKLTIEVPESRLAAISAEVKLSETPRPLVVVLEEEPAP